MACGYCGHANDWPFGKKHFEECAFSTVGIPMREKNVPPRIIDPFLMEGDGRKQLEKEFNAGKWRKLPDGKLQKVELEIDWPRDEVAHVI